MSGRPSSTPELLPIVQAPAANNTFLSCRMQISLPLDVKARVFISEVRSTARILIHRGNSSEAQKQID